MGTKIKIVALLAVIGLAAAAAFFFIDGRAQAGNQKYSVSTSPLFQFRNPDDSLVEGFPEVPGASSMLIRSKEGVTMIAQASGLEPGAAYTAWWVIFNHPEACSPPSCGEDDLLIFGGDPAVDSSALYAAGNLISDSGEGNFGAHLNVGDPPGQVLFGPGIVDPLKAEVHLVLRNHGPVRHNLAHEQLRTFGAGCSNAPPEFGTPGDFFCYDQLA